MKLYAVAAALAVWLCAGSLGRARESSEKGDPTSRGGEKERGLELGARAGYGIPMGNLDGSPGGAPITDAISGAVAVQVDLGYRLYPSLSLGGYFSYGFGTTPCPQPQIVGASVVCATNDIRLGFQARYHINPETTWDPWVGAGIGYERLDRLTTVHRTGFSSASSSIVHEGPEFLSVEGGMSLVSSTSLTLGPSFTFTSAEYSSEQSKALHFWLLLALQGSYVF